MYIPNYSITHSLTSPCFGRNIFLSTVFSNYFNVRCGTFHGLRPLACSVSELTSETVNPFGHFGRTPWTGDRPISMSIPMQDSTNKDADIHPSLERDSNPRAVQDYTRLRRRGFWDQL